MNSKAALRNRVSKYRTKSGLSRCGALDRSSGQSGSARPRSRKFVTPDHQPGNDIRTLQTTRQFYALLALHEANILCRRARPMPLDLAGDLANHRTETTGPLILHE